MPASTLNTAALAALETSIGRALAMDPDSAAKIAGLAGCVVHLHCETPQFDLYLLPGASDLKLLGSYEGDVDCRIRGTGSEFLELLAAADKPTAMINGGLTVTGDTASLLALGEILIGLDIDWEARLATVIVDIPAHQIGRAMRQAVQCGRGANNALQRHMEEFIHEEARLAPPRSEVDDFSDDLHALQLRIQRLAAKLKRQSRRTHELEEQ